MKFSQNVFVAFLVVFVVGETSTPARSAEPSGWRGDGLGRFPKAEPPLECAKDSENIAWRTKLSRGYSSPVLVGERLFLTTEPSDVVCISAEDGEEVWRRTVDYASALGEKEARRIAETRARLENDRRAANDLYNELRKAAPDSPKVEDSKQKRKAADDARRNFERQFPPEKRCGAGNAAATIMCDGERIYAVFGTGIVAVFTLHGEPLWSRHIEALQAGFGHSASPVLAGGNLIVHIEKMTSLQPANGNIVWQVDDVPARFGTPVITTIGKQDVVISPAGYFVAAIDGRILAKKQFSLSNNSPLVQNGVLYAHASGKTTAYSLPASLEEPFELKELWESSGAGDQRMATAVYHNGLLYAASRRGIIDVTDAETGRSVYKKRLDIGKIFSSPVLAGEYIYYCGRSGETIVLKAGRKFEQVAQNPLDRIDSLPVFAGKRMYLRTDKELVCVERSE